MHTTLEYTCACVTRLFLQIPCSIVNQNYKFEVPKCLMYTKACKYMHFIQVEPINIQVHVS